MVEIVDKYRGFQIKLVRNIAPYVTVNKAGEGEPSNTEMVVV